MIDGVDFQIDGLAALRDKLRRLQGTGARRVLTRASRAGMQETRKKARANAKRLDNPKTAENIAKNIAIKVNSKRFNSAGVILARVGVTGGAQQGKGGGGSGGDTYYWRFLEFGTSKMPAQPFLRPAMDASQITQAFTAAFAEAVDKELQKQGLS